MPDGQEVVILGTDGTEHVFPPGFDPKRAAAIVRGSGVPDASLSMAYRGKRDNLANPQSASEVQQAGSFATRMNATMQGAAHPQTAGDFLSLAVPNTLLAPGAARMASTVIPKGMVKAGTALERTGEALKPTSRTAAGLDILLSPRSMGNKAMEATATIAAPYAMKGAGRALRASGEFFGGATPAFNDLPLYKQMEHFPTYDNGPVQSGGRIQTPPYQQTGQAAAPRLAGPAPTVEASIGNVLDEIRATPTHTPTQTSLPPSSSQAALDTQRMLTEREAARKAAGHLRTPTRPAATSSPAVLPPEPHPDLPASWQPFAAHTPTPEPPPALPPLDPSELPSWSEQMRSTSSDWHSGATDPTEKAHAASLHRNDAELEKRYRYLLDNPLASLGGAAASAALLRAKLLALMKGQEP